MLSLQEISDRLEIQELLVRYSHTIDSRDWDAFMEVFTPDAIIDYTEMGGPRGDLASTRAFLQSTMPLFSSYQHLLTNFVIDITGDEAQARTTCINPMVLDRPDDGPHVFFCGLWYRDRLVRTPAGWRIADRYEERSYMFNTPPEVAAGAT